MKRYLSFLLSLVLILSTPFQAFAKEKKDKDEKAKDINIVSGEAGVFTASQAALITDSLKPSGFEEKQAKNVNLDQLLKVTLQDVVLETVSTSQNIKSAREKVVQSKLKLDKEYGNYYPTLSYEHRLSRTKRTPDDVKRPEDGSKYFGDRTSKFTLKQNIYTGGETVNNIKSLKKSYEVARNRYKNVIVSEIEKAIKAYLGVVFANISVDVNKKNMESLLKILDIVTVKFDAGAVSLGDMSSIKATVANSQSKLVKVQSKLTSALEYYAFIVGDKFINTLPYEYIFDTTIGDFEETYEYALKHNRNIQNYELNIQADKYKLKATKSSFRPKLDFEGTASTELNAEDFEGKQDTYKAELILSYNIYNGGKDKNKFLSIYSGIKELEFRQTEEIKKLKWTLSKLHTSVKTLKQTIESTKTEVDASKQMVESYWEGFKLGEQDLTSLLQGQRQLNDAQLNMVKYRENDLTDYFKILKEMGKLLDFFGIDIDKDNYLDFRGGIVNYDDIKKGSNLALDLNNGNKETNITNEDNNETNATIELNTTIGIEDNSSDELNTSEENITIEIIPFEERLFDDNESNYSISIRSFENIFKALDFIKENNMSNDSIAYGRLNGFKIDAVVAYGLYKNEENATKVLEELINTFDKNISIKDKEIVKKEYMNYLKGLTNNLKDEFIVKPEPPKIIKKPKVYDTDPIFKKKFLDANESMYTLNIASFSTIKIAKKVVKDYDIYKNSFVFKYGEKGEWVKLMYGLFDSYEKAESKLEELVNLDREYSPIIENVGSKQKLYKMFNTETNTTEEQIKPNIIIEEKVEEQNSSKEENKTEIIEELEGVEGDSFKERFLKAPEGYYSYNMATFDNMEQGERFIDKYGIGDKSFAFEFGKDKRYVKVVYGLYDDWTRANEAIVELPQELQENKPYVERVEVKQKLYRKYNSEDKEEKEVLEKNESVEENNINEENSTILETNTTEILNTEKNTTEEQIEPNIIIEEKVEEQNSSKEENKTEIIEELEGVEGDSFKERFLKAPEGYYSYNMATFDNMEQGKRFIDKYGIGDKSFAFEFGKDKRYVKVVYGLYDEWTRANEAIVELPQELQENKPYVERVEVKQKLYRKYNSEDKEDKEDKEVLENNESVEENNINEENSTILEELKENKKEDESIKEIDDKEFTKNFSSVLKNSSLMDYTILIGVVDSDELYWFLNRYSISKAKSEVLTKSDGKSYIYFGKYNSLREAHTARLTLHPKLMEKDPLVLMIGDILE